MASQMASQVQAVDNSVRRWSAVRRSFWEVWPTSVEHSSPPFLCSNRLPKSCPTEGRVQELARTSRSAERETEKHTWRLSRGERYRGIIGI
jgi:hypothetical protein